MRRSRRGIALVLVLTVVLALALIATPFVLSMTKQEGAATAAKAERQTQYGSEGARNFAATLLQGGMDFHERRRPLGPVWDTPYADTRRELSVDLRDRRLQPLNVLDPVGKIWGVTAEDEQGKLNLRTAPEPVVRTLRSFFHPGIVDPKSVTTIYSGRDARWIFPQRIRSVGTFPFPSGAVRGLSADSVVHFGREAKIRCTKRGLQPLPAVVTRNCLRTEGGHVIQTNPEIPPGYAGGIIEVEQLHPVNVNTARREVLVAMFEGVSLRVPRIPQDAVTREEAQAIAARLEGQAFDNWGALARHLLTQITEGSVQDRVAILLSLADPNHHWLDGTGTVPGTFVSWDTVTVEARAIVNGPSGVPRSGTGFREVVDLGPPASIWRLLESQHDFDRFLRAAEYGMAEVSAVAPFSLAGPFQGYPFGNRVDSFPNAFPVASGKVLKPQQVPGQTEAYLQVESAEDRRGSAQYIDTRHHFQDTVEGRRLAGSTLSYPWSEVFSENPRPLNADPNANFPDTAAGGMEMWVRFDALASPTTLFDIREQDTSNRITLVWQGAELVLTVTDGTRIAPPGAQLAKGLGEIRHPFVPLQDTWYHVGAYWKGTRWGQLALLVDGFSDPLSRMRHLDETGQTETMTELGSAYPIPPPPPAPPAIPPPPPAMPLRNAGWIPAPPATEVGNTVPLLVGDEVIHYDQATRIGFRAQRGTAARNHPAGAKVQLFGYSSKLRPHVYRQSFTINNVAVTVDADLARLPTTSGAVSDRFGVNPGAIVDPSGSGITASQTDIPAVSPNINDFPAKGYLVIESEMIYYDRINTAVVPPRFEGCVRGEEGTTAAPHVAAPIELGSIGVTNTNGYGTPNTFVQIEDEWFGPVKRATARPDNFWVGLWVGTPATFRNFRSALGSVRTVHLAAERVIPLFFVSDSDRNVQRWNAARWDWVTLTDGQNGTEVGRVRRAHNLSDNAGMAPSSVVPGTPDHARQIVGLWDHVTRDYVPDNHHVRMMKWPSGELLSMAWLQTAGPQFTIGPGGLTVDEVKFFASPKGLFDLGQETTAQQSSILLGNASGLDPDVGAIKVGDEIIGYAGMQASALNPAARGWLNSASQIHARGELVFNLSFLPITKMSQDVGTTEASLPVAQPFSGSGYTAGYAKVGNELFGFETNGTTLDCPPTFDGQGLWRGRFGTTAEAHARGDLVYGIPFRTWDTYRALEFDNRMAWYQASWTVRGARWRNVRWDQQIPASDVLLRTHALVRADGMGEWYDPPAVSNRTLMWDFTDPQGKNVLDHPSGLRDGGQLDVRLQVEYLQDAYWPNHAWKRTPRIQQVMVEYDRPAKVVFHEDE